ncbi:O-antigen ligase family protein [Chachezhania sediminis]|uniref:O-antigen ligase family protein n=1 Tax=Chachezhania sediminis TaxID=2599291 RepID=UPI00131E97CF|nr:O-antigen ligase family protein [Chachezhania sediminis]
MTSAPEPSTGNRINRTRNMAVRVGPILLTMAMLGAVRSVGTFPIYLGYLSALAGICWLVLTMRISRFLLPSYLLFAWGIVSLVYHGLGPISYIQLCMVLGGLGVAEIVARINPAVIADVVSRRLIWLIVLVVIGETLLIAAGFGERSRELQGELTGGLLPDLGIQVPRYLGPMGGSGFSGALTGALALLCLTEGRKRAAWTLFFITILMVSRGPLLGLILAGMFHMLRGWKIFRRLALIMPLITVSSPILVYWLQNVLTTEQILFLIEVSTRRFLHFMTFLQWGLDNPIFGIGYSNWQSVYSEYFFERDFQQWGHRTNLALIKEAHNFMLDIFGEMGVVGWLLASLQMMMTAVSAFSRDARYGSVFLFISISYLFLSGLSNWTYWLVTGLVMGYARLSRAADAERREAAANLRDPPA